MSSSIKLTNSSGKIVTITNPDTTSADVTVDLLNNAYTIATVDDFGTVPVGYTTVIVKDTDRGGVFNRIASTTANGGTIFDGTTGYSWERQYSGAINVKWFGAYSDSTHATETTTAIQAALDTGLSVLYPEGSYLINDTLSVRYGATIEAYSSFIFADTNMTNKALYELIGNVRYVTFAGGHYRGIDTNYPLKYFAYLEGTKTYGTQTYPLQPFMITFKDLEVNVVDIAIKAYIAARLEIHNCRITGYTNALNMEGKIVETMINDCVIFGNTSSGSKGIYVHAYDDGSGVYAIPEGLHLTNSTVDAFEENISIADLYAGFISNCFLGSGGISNTYSVVVSKGIGNFVRRLNIYGNELAAIKFTPITGGNMDIQAIINDNIFESSQSYGILIGDSWSGISITSNTFINGSESASVFRLERNQSQIAIENNRITSGFANLVSLWGNGSGVENSKVVFKNNTGDLAFGNSLTMYRNEKNNGRESNYTFTHITGSAIPVGSSLTGTLSKRLLKGTNIRVFGRLSPTFTGSPILYVYVTNTSGIRGSGWDAHYLFPRVADSQISFEYVVTVTSDSIVDASILVIGGTGTFTTGGHDFMAFEVL